MPQQPQNSKAQKLGFMQLSRLSRAREAEYTLQSKFEYGYRNKEDVSNLPANTLVVGSQNVLTNASEVVQIRQGFVLDGPAGTSGNANVDSNYDFLTHSGTVVNTRKWGTNWEVRYVNPLTGVVSWINIFNAMNTSKLMQFTSFFDINGEVKNLCLACNGGGTIYEWTGAIGTFASSSSAAGIIQTIAQPTAGQNQSGGTGYVIGDILPITGSGGSGATLQVDTVASGGVNQIQIHTPGSSYAQNDIIAITAPTGGQNAYIIVNSVDGGGAVLTFSIQVAGYGFVANSGLIVNTTGGSGTGFNVNVTGIGNSITAWHLVNVGSGYSTGNYVSTSGGSGTGATVHISAVVTGALTLQGSLTTAQLNFYNTANNAGKFNLLIDGVQYSYTGVSGNSFIGVGTIPGSVQVGDAVIQAPVAIPSANISGLPTTFSIDLIGTFGNQVYYGSLSNNAIYTSQTNVYTSVTYNSPRQPGDGALNILDACPTGFVSAETMYVSAGLDQWWRMQTTLSSTNADEVLFFDKLRTAPLQAAQEQGLMAYMKNQVIFVSQEPIFNALGLVENLLSGQFDPQFTNMSDPIKYDFDAYNFKGGQVFYYKYFIYIALPAMGIVRIFNLNNKYWEAPQTLPISRFYLVNGQLYGHSSETNESYRLFTGYNDNGNPINAVAAFPYVSQEGSEASQKKWFNKLYTEGYISTNAVLTAIVNYDFGGYTSSQAITISGNNKNKVFNAITDGSIGQNPLGSEPIGSILNLPTTPAYPKFRSVDTFPAQNCFEFQNVYTTNAVDAYWAILRFGLNIKGSTDIPIEITT